MGQPSTPQAPAWETEEAVGGIELAPGLLLRVAHCSLRQQHFVSLQTLRRAPEPAQGWAVRAQVVVPAAKVAALCALLQRSTD